MTRMRWDIDVERVVVRGAGAPGLEAVEVRRLVEEALVARLGHLPMPTRRAIRTEVVIESGPLAAGDPGGIARVVAGGVVEAATGRRTRG